MSTSLLIRMLRRRIIEVFISPLWLVPLLGAAGALVYARVTQGPIINPWMLWLLAALVFANVALRLLYLLAQAGGQLRYPSRPLFAPTFTHTYSREELALREALNDAGYVLMPSRDGHYGERRDPAYWAGVLANIALAVVLATGMYNFVNQFQGEFTTGYNQKFSLNDRTQYKRLTTGFSSMPDGLRFEFYTGKIHDHSETWPEGAADAEIRDLKGQVLDAATLSPGGKTLETQGVSIQMLGFVYEVYVYIRDENGPLIGGNNMLFRSHGNGDLTYAADVPGLSPGVDGTLMFDPVKRELKAIVRKDGAVIHEMLLGMFKRSRLERDGMQAAFNAYARWAHYVVFTERVLWPLYVGGVILVLGLLVRLLVWPRRVWLRTTKRGCRVKATHPEVHRLLHALDDEERT